ncbi:pyridoxamine 5'-phosphate oxidase family protein [Marinibacterium sp. SX1]|uniref:pyridoxamine 5'-phosphate oxidase family protein n=1 Tax=Marinibacterium sp. SX1 TaxID=3388424 RepID=UPI003D1793F3
MAKQFDRITDDQKAFVEAQHMFFTGTAAPDGRVNVSPKGQDALRILSPNRVVWLNLTGSGNETAGHLLEHPRMTLMWCSFERRPLIYRMYGTARTIHRGDTDWDGLYALFPDHPGARQVYDMAVEMTQTSCGYAVPFMDFAGDRDTLTRWTEDRKGRDGGLPAYWAEKNMQTIDGRPTGFPQDLTRAPRPEEAG